MTSEFDEFIKTFKPEFGNEGHLNILSMLAKLKKKEKSVNELLISQVAIKREMVEINQAEKQIRYLIEYERNNNS